MKMTANVKISNRLTVTAEIEGKMDVCLSGLNALLAYDGKCGLCGKENIILQIKKVKGYEFTEYICKDCGAKAQWGLYKSGGYFLKPWEQYQPNGNTSGEQPSEEHFEDDVPF